MACISNAEDNIRLDQLDRMSAGCASGLIVGIKQKEGGLNKDIVLECGKASASLSRNQPSRRPSGRLCTQEDSNGSNENGCASSVYAWRPSPASLPSPAEVSNETLAPKISSGVATGDLEAATCLSISTKAADPASPLEENTSELLMWTCEFCAKGFSRKKYLKFHMDCVHNNLHNVTCDICGDSFKRKSLRRHVQDVHENLRNFPCDVCGSSFKRREALKDHFNNVHKKVRKFKCEICGFGFSRKIDMEKHINCVHKNQQTVTCAICSNSFKRKGELRKHVYAMHKNRHTFPCDVCGRSFKAKGALKTHINTVHEKLRAFSCAICGRAFTQNSARRRHLRQLHPESKREKPESPS